jgi:hypothetical protein
VQKVREAIGTGCSFSRNVHCTKFKFGSLLSAPALSRRIVESCFALKIFLLGQLALSGVLSSVPTYTNKSITTKVDHFNAFMKG